jgi:hypothetical protein
MSSTILFHGNCIDGFTSAFLAHMALTAQGVADIKMYPVAPTGAGLPHPKDMAGRHVRHTRSSIEVSLWLESPGLGLSIDAMTGSRACHRMGDRGVRWKADRPLKGGTRTHMCFAGRTPSL